MKELIPIFIKLQPLFLCITAAAVHSCRHHAKARQIALDRNASPCGDIDGETIPNATDGLRRIHTPTPATTTAACMYVQGVQVLCYRRRYERICKYECVSMDGLSNDCWCRHCEGTSELIRQSTRRRGTSTTTDSNTETYTNVQMRPVVCLASSEPFDFRAPCTCV